MLAQCVFRQPVALRGPRYMLLCPCMLVQEHSRGHLATSISSKLLAKPFTVLLLCSLLLSSAACTDFAQQAEACKRPVKVAVGHEGEKQPGLSFSAIKSRIRAGAIDSVVISTCQQDLASRSWARSIRLIFGRDKKQAALQTPCLEIQQSCFSGTIGGNAATWRTLWGEGITTAVDHLKRSNLHIRRLLNSFGMSPNQG